MVVAHSFEEVSVYERSIFFLSDFILVTCDFVRFQLILILKQILKPFFNIQSLIMAVVSVETLEELKQPDSV